MSPTENGLFTPDEVKQMKTNDDLYHKLELIHRDMKAKDEHCDKMCAQVHDNSTFIQYCKYGLVGLAIWFVGADRIPSWVFKWLAI